MNLTQKAYLAGIIDGEGTVTLIRKHGNETPSPEVSIANTNLQLLQWVQTTTGKGTISKKWPRSARHSMAYIWKARGDSALELLKHIKKWLIIKKERAELLVRKYKRVTVRNGRYTPEQLKQKLELFTTFKKLNNRILILRNTGATGDANENRSPLSSHPIV